MSLPYEPFVTIVMPVRNEIRYIERSLGSVLAQEYPMDRLEIIVADGHSDDGTPEKISEIHKRHPQFAIRMIKNEQMIAPTGLNSAIEIAKGDIIVRVDGHCEIPPNYVRNCVEHLNRDDVGGVGGRVITIGETDRAQLISLGMSSIFGVGGSAFRTVRDARSIFVDSVPFPAYTRKSIQKAGLYSTELVRNQDDEYNYRLRKKGVKILLAGNVFSNYYSRSSFSSLWKQYFYYGFWKVRVLQKHPRQMSLRQFVPPMFVLALLFSAVFLFYPSLRVWAAVVPSLYLLVNFSATAYHALSKHEPHVTIPRWKIAAGLPLVFFILHIAYGLGFLIGLARFVHRWGEV